MPIIDQKISKLITTTGFITEYYKQLNGCKTNAEAYQKVEEIYFKYFGKNKYSNFESFRQVRDYRLKKKKK